MPEVTGVVNDPIRGKSYLVKISGSDAAEVFAFNLRHNFNRSDYVQLKSVPTIVTTSGEDDIIDAKKGHYILSDIEIQNSMCDEGNYTCPKSGAKFVKQATLFPYDTMTMIVTGYLKNGEMLMAPLHPKRTKHRTLIYPISLIEVGAITDLETPVSLAIAKKKLFDSRASARDSPSTSSHFLPIADDEVDHDMDTQAEPDENADNTAASVASTASLGSEIITGTRTRTRLTS